MPAHDRTRSWGSRIDNDLRKPLEEAAKAANRSRGDEISLRLRHSLETVRAIRVTVHAEPAERPSALIERIPESRARRGGYVP